MDKKTKDLIQSMKEVKLWKVSTKNEGGSFGDIYFTSQASANKYCGELPLETTVESMEVSCCKNVAGKYYIFLKLKLLPITVRHW